ncbi:hypothetical protein BJ165DRAFT_1426732 [Panaeolus papilionaceus]|nr:hypothetical protein BJ165DRAFT_1426732 [Panaeolus papilionaceus]
MRVLIPIPTPMAIPTCNSTPTRCQILTPIRNPKSPQMGRMLILILHHHQRQKAHKPQPRPKPPSHRCKMETAESETK